MKHMTKIQWIWLLSFGLLVPKLVSAQRVTTCEEVGIKPTSGNGVLRIYLEGDSTGVGGRGCWVHHHDNNKDMVITPYSWGRDPNARRKRLINEVLEAITDSRRVYEAYGTLDNKHFYILNDLYYSDVDSTGTRFPYEGEVVEYVNDECWVRSGCPIYGDYLRGNENRYLPTKSGIVLTVKIHPPYEIGFH